MIERTVSLQKLKAYTGKPLIKIISGMRRVGKSILLKQFRDKLFDENIPKKNILLINMESLENDFIKDYMDLYNYVKQELSLQSGKKYLLIDEVQEIEKWEKAVNSFLSDGAYDITLTGSNARMLSAELSTLLSGRYIEFPLYPFTFRDFLRIRKLNNSEEHIRDTFGHFLRYGGLPGIHTLPFSDEIIFPYLNAPLIVAAFISKPLGTYSGFSNRKPFLNLGVAIINVLSSFSTASRTGLCGESGQTKTTSAF